MKIASLTFLLVLFVALPGFAQWSRDGKPQPDSDDRKSLNGFGANLLVLKNPRDVIKEWQKPETPHFDPANNVKRGEAIGVFVFFAGCKKDRQGNCNTEVDYTVYKPDGSLYAERKAQTLWKEEAPPPPIIQMGRAILAFAAGQTDPLGEYKVKAKVSDLTAGTSFELTTNFNVK